MKFMFPSIILVLSTAPRSRYIQDTQPERWSAPECWRSVLGWRWVCSRARTGDGIVGIPTGTIMMWFIKIERTSRIPTPFPLPVVMVEEEDGGAEVTSIVRAETTLPPQAVRKEAEEQATEPARQRIVRPMRMGKWQIAVRARWALRRSRD